MATSSTACSASWRLPRPSVSAPSNAPASWTSAADAAWRATTRRATPSTMSAWSTPWPRRSPGRPRRSGSGWPRPGEPAGPGWISTTRWQWSPSGHASGTRCSRRTPIPTWRPSTTASRARRRTSPASFTGWTSRLPEPPLAGEFLRHEDPAISARYVAIGLAVAQPGVDGQVLGHDLVRVQGEPVQPVRHGLLLGELHELSPQPDALRGRADGDGLDQKAVYLSDQHDDADDRLPEHPDLAGLDGGTVVGQYRGSRGVHPVRVPGVGRLDHLVSGRQVR